MTIQEGNPVSPSQSASPGRLLTQAAGERHTGALVVGGQPGGTVHLVEGAVVYAESPAAPGVGELLTSSGRLAGRTWQSALDAGAARSRVGQVLLEQGHLTQGELELCVLGAIYDAAYFALAPAEAPAEFRAGVTHWLGPVVRVEAAAVDRESRRRARLLDEIHPNAQIDSAPVIPVPRPPVERITLTAPQWELLVHADGQRTPADLAQLLGRAGYATVQELRRLAALGLIEEPAARPADDPALVRQPRARGTAVDVHRAVPGQRGEPLVEVVNRARAEREPAGSEQIGSEPAGSEPVATEPAGTVYRPPRLARRKPGAKLPNDLVAEPPAANTGADEVLLKRIRTALRALR
jgi:hypothetical protein